METHGKKLLVELPKLDKGDHLYLVFHPARPWPGRPQPPAPEGLRWRYEKVPGNVLLLEAVRDVRRPSIEVEGTGGTVELTQRVLKRKSKGIDVWYLDRKDSPPVRFEEAEPSLPDTETYLEELWGLLDEHEDSPYAIWRYRRFFSDLDRHTDDHMRAVYLEDKDPEYLSLLDSAIPTVLGMLWDRLTRRAMDPLSRIRHEPIPGADGVMRELQAVSDLFLMLVERHFRAPSGQIDVDAFEDAFEMFVNGELRLWLPKAHMTTVQPDSGLVFFFAEFALLCAGAGIETELWTSLANVLVRCQHVYVRVYAAGVPSPGLYDYSPEKHSFERRFTRREKEELRARHRGFDLARLNVCQARNLETFAPGSLPSPNYPIYDPANLGTPEELLPSG